MRVAFLILVHKNPAQLQRMIQAMDHPDFDYYLHVDLKADQAPFADLSKLSRVYFIGNRIKVFWGKYSLVQATLNGMAEILACGNYDYIHVMSAQDFPIKSASYIHQYLKDHAGTEFITCLRESENHEWWADAALHVWKYNFHNWRIPGKYKLQALANRLLPARTYPLAGHEVVGHSNWFTISTAAAQYMLTFLKEHPRVVHFFKYVWGADELIFSTVLYNSPFQSRIKDNLLYIDWSEHTANPKLLGMQDLPAIMQSDKLFARKFDQDKDPNVLEQLEQNLRGQGQ